VAQQPTTPPAGTADPMTDAAVNPGASLFVRHILQSALANVSGSSPQPPWAQDAQALLANVLMNDYLNWWNSAGQSELDAAKIAASQAGDSALANHARGLIYRATGQPNPARKAFRAAKELDSEFARAHAQFGNQKSALSSDEVQDPLNKAIALSPRHPASGYFYWGKGRGYFERKDWGDAIYWLKKSVEVLPTVWYNRCYLAAAQHNSADRGDHADALKTIEDFINDFDKASLERIKQLTPDPNYPMRKTVLDFVRPLLP